MTQCPLSRQTCLSPLIPLTPQSWAPCAPLMLHLPSPSVLSISIPLSISLCLTSSLSLPSLPLFLPPTTTLRLSLSRFSSVSSLFCPNMSVCSSSSHVPHLSVSLCISLSHIYTHTHTHDLRFCTSLFTCLECSPPPPPFS